MAYEAAIFFSHLLQISWSSLVHGNLVLATETLLRGNMQRAFQRDDLMAILDGIDDAVVKLDGQAYFTAMNQVAAEVYRRLGFDPQKMLGRSAWELFPELKGTFVERELRQVIEDHVQVAYEFYYPKDQHWYQTKGYPASPGAILVFRDITIRKAAAPSS